LRDFLKKKIKADAEKIEQFSSLEVFTQLFELSTQELLYDMFIEFEIDFISITHP
jgi:hypothetical protein